MDRLFGLVVACAVLLAPAAAHARDWVFDVTLDGLSIGTHCYSLHNDGDARRLASDAHFRVRPMTFAYRNPRMFTQRELVNPQTGALTPVTAARLARTAITVQGRRVEAGGYRVDTGKTRIDAYYDEAGDWIGLRSTTREGHVLEYRLR